MDGKRSAAAAADATAQPVNDGQAESKRARAAEGRSEPLDVQQIVTASVALQHLAKRALAGQLTGVLGVQALQAGGEQCAEVQEILFEAAELHRWANQLGIALDGAEQAEEEDAVSLFEEDGHEETEEVQQQAAALPDSVMDGRQRMWTHDPPFMPLAVR